MEDERTYGLWTICEDDGTGRDRTGQNRVTETGFVKGSYNTEMSKAENADL